MSARYCEDCGSPVARIEQPNPGQPVVVVCPECGNQIGRRPGATAAGILTRSGKDGAEVLLIRRRPEVHYGAGRYCLPGKRVEWMEDARDAVVRAFWELTGIRIEVGPSYEVHSNFADPRLLTVGTWFQVRGDAEEAIAGSDADEVDFFSLKQLPDLAYPTEALVLERLGQEMAAADTDAHQTLPDLSARLYRAKRKFRDLLEAYNNVELRGAWINELHTRLGKEDSARSISDVAATQLAERTEVDEVRIWYLGPPDRCRTCPWVDRCPKEQCLHLTSWAAEQAEVSAFGEVEVSPEPEGPKPEEERIPLIHGVPAAEVALQGDTFQAELPGAGATPHRFEGFPLESGEGLPGVLGLISRTPMDSNARRLFEIVARHVGTLVRNARLVEDLRLANQVKLGFIGRMSHELKTPLTAILGYSELLKDELEMDGNTMGAEGAATIEQSGRKLLGIVESILEIAKLQSGSVRFRPKALNLLEVIEERLPKYRKKASQKTEAVRVGSQSKPPELTPQGVAVRFDPPPIDADLTVWADRQRLHQILDELVGNATKFTPTGGSITISVQPAGEHVTCSVQDTGFGIAPEHHAMIFEPFQQVSEKIHLDYGGLGIGLAMVRALVDHHGGRVWVESQLDEGSCFSFTLPRSAPNPATR